MKMSAECGTPFYTPDPRTHRTHALCGVSYPSERRGGDIEPLLSRDVRKTKSEGSKDGVKAFPRKKKLKFSRRSCCGLSDLGEVAVVF